MPQPNAKCHRGDRTHTFGVITGQSPITPWSVRADWAAGFLTMFSFTKNKNTRTWMLLYSIVASKYKYLGSCHWLYKDLLIKKKKHLLLHDRVSNSRSLNRSPTSQTGINTGCMVLGKKHAVRTNADLWWTNWKRKSSIWKRYLF